MKVVIVGPAFPLRGGIANFNESLCREFVKANHNASIYSFSLQYPSFLFPGTTQYDTGKGPADISIKTVINSINPLNWISTALKIKKEKPDLVIVRFWIPFMAPCLGTIMRIIKFNSNIKIIAITDNVIPHEKRFGDRIFTKYFVKSCQGFVAMSKAVLNDLNNFTINQNKAFIPHPIYDTFGEKVSKKDALQKLKLDPSKHYILFFGFIRQYKGLDLLLKAMADAQIKKLNIHLIVAGEFYESPEPYLELIQKGNLEGHLILNTHYIHTDLVKYYFCAADLIVQPYHTATQSGVTQIAYHFERPMLVTNVGGLAEMVPHQICGYVAERDPQQIAQYIKDFYLESREEDMVKNTIQEKKNFSWQAMVQGILNLKKQL
ncbi:MAG TPA: glycosyltransferase [Bacteroidia bacterium]|nr:glycosyltransferase [Bacteroidia bacterium]